MVDLAPEVRRAAVSALVNRPPREFRALLLAGFRHPWPPVAAHAAEALVAVNDRQSAAALVSLLDRPAPGLPVPVSGAASTTFTVRELVRVNHLRNCLLCHPPSFSDKDLVRKSVPSPLMPLDPVSAPYGAPGASTFVRADVTYLRQDFSVVQPVDKPPKDWPTYQRFDYLTHVRLVDLAEAERLARGKTRTTREYHDNILFALQRLTGAERGDTAADWRLLLERSDLAPGDDGPIPGAVAEWKQFLTDEPPPGPSDVARRPLQPPPGQRARPGGL
jgi:hypothetical protein